MSQSARTLIARLLRPLCRLVMWAAGTNWHAIRFYRLSHRLHRSGWPEPAAAIRSLARALTGVDIAPGARIGEGFNLLHGGMGVVIGQGAVIGNDVMILPQVTIGAGSLDEPASGTIGDRVWISTGAKVLGPITVGHDAVIGANAVVVDDVPPWAVVVGVPAKILRYGTGRLSDGQTLGS
jgi:serine O-acetyltransferase